MKKKKIKHSAGDNIFNAGILIFVLSFAFVCLFPFLNTFANAFSDNHAIMSGKVTIYPVGFQIDAFKFVVGSSAVIRSLFVTVFVTIVGTALNMMLTILTAYPVSRKYLRGRSQIMMFIIVTMLFSGGLIPGYLLVKSLNLLDSVWSIILPTALSTFNLIIMKTFFQSIPDEIEESAKMDGCNNVRLLITMYIPLSIPGIATLSLFYAVNHWNNYFNPMLYISDPDIFTLQIKLRQILLLSRQSEILDGLSDASRAAVMEESLKSAVVIFSMLPILCVYPWLQKYFVKGVMIGAVKG
jgi:putative aldouronate transport system permease protein